MNISQFDVKKLDMGNLSQNPGDHDMGNLSQNPRDHIYTSATFPEILNYGSRISGSFVDHNDSPSQTLARVCSKTLTKDRAGMVSDRNVHKVLERERRKDMKNRFCLLRTVLPEKYLMGRRSVSDQVQGAVEYINHLQEYINHLQGRVKELAMERNSMRLLVMSDREDKTFKPMHSCRGSDDFPTVRIMAIGSGIEILTKTLKDGVIFSDILHLLETDGLEVVSFTASTTEDKVFHSIHSKVAESFDNSKLYEKLCRLIMPNVADAA